MVSMPLKNSLLVFALAALTIAVTYAGAQNPPATSAGAPPPPAADAPAQPPAAAAGPGQGRGQRGVFPAMQRPLADPAVIERGRTLYGSTARRATAPTRGAASWAARIFCDRSSCCSIRTASRSSRWFRRGAPERGMPPFPASEEDIKAIVEFIHSLTGASRGQGAPPGAEGPPPNIVIGDATAGQAFFAANCSSCHSPTGDLQGIAHEVPDPKLLQNLWVSGGSCWRPWRRRGGLPPGPRVDGHRDLARPVRNSKDACSASTISSCPCCRRTDRSAASAATEICRRSSSRSARRSSQASRRLQRQEHARCDGLPGYAEMTMKKHC